MFVVRTHILKRPHPQVTREVVKPLWNRGLGAIYVTPPSAEG